MKRKQNIYIIGKYDDKLTDLLLDGARYTNKKKAFAYIKFHKKYMSSYTTPSVFQLKVTLKHLKAILVTFIVGLTLNVSATELTLRTGLGQKYVQNQKYLSITARERVVSVFHLYGSVGGINHVNFLTQNWNTFVSVGTEALAENDILYASASVGVAVFDKRTTGIATHLQVENRVAFGVVSKGLGAKLGIFGAHFSNGSGSSENLGADFLGIELSLR